MAYRTRKRSRAAASMASDIAGSSRRDGNTPPRGRGKGRGRGRKQIDSTTVDESSGKRAKITVEDAHMEHVDVEQKESHEKIENNQLQLKTDEEINNADNLKEISLDLSLNSQIEDNKRLNNKEYVNTSPKHDSEIFSAKTNGEISFLKLNNEQILAEGIFEPDINICGSNVAEADINICGTNVTEDISGTNIAEDIIGSNNSKPVSEFNSVESISEFDSNKAVSALGSEKSISEFNYEKPISGQDFAEHVSELHNHKPASESISGLDSKVDSPDPVCVLDSDKPAFSVHFSESVSASDSEKHISWVDSEKNITAIDCGQPVSGVDSEKNISADDSEKLISEFSSDKDISGCDNKAVSGACSDGKSTFGTASPMRPSPTYNMEEGEAIP